MTTTRLALLSLSTLLLTSASHAAPPAELSGRFVSLQGNRLEFPDAAGGTDGSLAVTYRYEVTGELSASLEVSYPSTGRLRQVTLNFLDDGTPDGYREFDFASTNPPMPPRLSSGAFEIGDLEVTPAESSAPDSLVGSFVRSGRQRVEFLTADRGRRYVPGAAEYFRYTYRIVDEVSAEAILTDEARDRVTRLLLTFDAEGDEVSLVATVTENGGEPSETSGRFELGENRNLADLQIGADETSLIGDDFYSASGHHQTARRVLTQSTASAYHVAIQNDGDTGAFRLRATRGHRHLDLAYFSYPERENLTAALTAGTFETGDLGHGESRAFTLEIAPGRETGAVETRVEARSTTVRKAKDEVHSFTLYKSRGKPGHSHGKRGRR